jgi:hypothetical protein
MSSGGKTGGNSHSGWLLAILLWPDRQKRYICAGSGGTPPHCRCDQMELTFLKNLAYLLSGFAQIWGY